MMINIMQKQKIIDFPKQYLNGRMQNVISKKKNKLFSVFRN